MEGPFLTKKRLVYVCTYGTVFRSIVQYCVLRDKKKKLHRLYFTHIQKLVLGREKAVMSPYTTLLNLNRDHGFQANLFKSFLLNTFGSQLKRAKTREMAVHIGTKRKEYIQRFIIYTVRTR